MIMRCINPHFTYSLLAVSLGQQHQQQQTRIKDYCCYLKMLALMFITADQTASWSSSRDYQVLQLNIVSE